MTTKRRSPLLPEVPTIAEAGVAEFDYPIWYGVWVRAGTPAGVVDKLAKDIARVLATPDLRDWLAKHGADPMTMTQPEFARFVQARVKALRVSSKPPESNVSGPAVHKSRTLLSCGQIPQTPRQLVPHTSLRSRTRVANGR